jgi:hypothetical protein
MNEDIPEVLSQLVTRDDFDKEILRAIRRTPYNAELIADYIMAACTDYKQFGDSDEGYFKAALVEAVLDGMPVVCAYMSKCEQDRSAMLASYNAANSRANESLGRFKFWQGVSFGLAFITVLYCAFRTVVWIAPHVGEMKNWLDLAL